MIPAPDFDDSTPAPAPGSQKQLDQLSSIASSFSMEFVDIAGTLDQIDDHTRQQLQTLEQVRAMAQQMLDGNRAVRGAVDTVNETTRETLETVIRSVENIQSAGNRTQKLAGWVQSLDQRITAIEDTISSARANNDEIASIAAQVNILAINAKIEAARAGESGRGFAVVAEAINELSRKTASAAEGISGSIMTFGDWVDSLREEAETATEDANGVLSEAEDTDLALSGIAEHVRMINSEARDIKDSAGNVGKLIEEFGQSFEQMSVIAKETANGIHQVRDRADGMIDHSESLVQHVVHLGGNSIDAKFIEEVQNRAAMISAAFEEGLKSGAISQAALFSKELTPIRNSNPQQVMAPFTRFTDSVLPAIQEPALEFDPRVVFCATINRLGYIPTHNLKFSKPQGNDPVWNMANCRNRRVFDDRVGLKAGNNKEPFLLQVYRRDMGGGEFRTMKDVSAPVFVEGKLWGGLRLAYTT
ncbi:MAG TPA: methyl-accepting chemotaxis protein [Rhodobacteraceae bacterium]|nr:methyl-accepting chemotaxis protein [Paracoccaceae bacterium]